MSDIVGTPMLEAPRPKARRTSTWSSTWARSIRPRTACCAWCWRSTAKSSSALYPKSAICTPASKRPARRSFTSRWFRSPIASIISIRISNNLCYCLAVEKLLELEIPERAQWIRVLLAELSRLNSHLIWLGTHAMDIGALTVFLYSFREREEILRIFETVSGQRMMTSYFRIGGLAMEPPLGSVRSHPGLHPDLPGEDRRVFESAHRQSNLPQPPEGRWQSFSQRTRLRSA